MTFGKLAEIIDSWRITPRLPHNITKAIAVGPSSYQVLGEKQLLPKDLLLNARKIEPSEIREAIKLEIKAARKMDSVRNITIPQWGGGSAIKWSS